MNSVYMIYSHRMAPGRSNEYLEYSAEAFPLVEKHMKSGLIKEMKVLRKLTGSESFAMIARFNSMADATVYMDDFNKSGLSLKYQDVQLDTKIELYEILEDDDVQSIFDILKTLK
ncbi:hypothetical protein EZV73_04825 [Acidaminobacter sp. JC074]|uniref:hypothetical protein n=1 Tax=Acidaminobacter sp. JC074 TaxID=2530199 RepID=UPI001F0E6D51|nr:hypothetical protein [Acidaminobacter sp. JC074]MCH4886878.1 hypothetical protein [Acidaminobacter sp. JC074]